MAAPEKKTSGEAASLFRRSAEGSERTRATGRAGDARRTSSIEVLGEIAALLAKTSDWGQAVDAVLGTLAHRATLGNGTLCLLNRYTEIISIDVSKGLDSTSVRETHYRLGEGVTGTVIASGEPIVIERIGESERFLGRTGRQRPADTSFICVPIKTAHRTYGALSAERPFDPEHDLDRDLRLLEIVAAMIAQAVRARQHAEEERANLEAENERLRAQLEGRYRPANIIGRSHEMNLVYEQITTVSKSTTTVLLGGETGTGKELVAQAIHFASERSHMPFVKVHCAALPEGVIESELFGHVKGAFTGAMADRKGRFELADGGTLFLDEIGDISPLIQIKLLRVLQERELERVGGVDTRKVNIRLIAATHRDLAQMVSDGDFREDLYYRLNVFPIHVPALRKRRSDIVLLADHFLELYSEANGRHVQRLSTGVIDMLMSYHWPGNVRELESCMERAVLVAEGDVVHPRHLPPTLQTAESTGAVPVGSLKERVAAYERDLIADALKSARGNMAEVARLLDSTQRIIAYKVKQLGIDPGRFRSS